MRLQFSSVQTRLKTHYGSFCQVLFLLGEVAALQMQHLSKITKQVQQRDGNIGIETIRDHEKRIQISTANIFAHIPCCDEDIIGKSTCTNMIFSSDHSVQTVFAILKWFENLCEGTIHWRCGSPSKEDIALAKKGEKQTQGRNGVSGINLLPKSLRSRAAHIAICAPKALGRMSCFGATHTHC